MQFIPAGYLTQITAMAVAVTSQVNDSPYNNTTRKGKKEATRNKIDHTCISLIANAEPHLAGDVIKRIVIAGYVSDVGCKV